MIGAIILKLVVSLLVTFWTVGSMFCILFGITGMVNNATYGTEDEDYKRSKTILVWFLLPFVAAIKVYKLAEKEAKDVDRDG